MKFGQRKEQSIYCANVNGFHKYVLNEYKRVCKIQIQVVSEQGIQFAQIYAARDPGIVFGTCVERCSVMNGSKSWLL